MPRLSCEYYYAEYSSVLALLGEGPLRGWSYATGVPHWQPGCESGSVCPVTVTTRSQTSAAATQCSGWFALARPRGPELVELAKAQHSHFIVRAARPELLLHKLVQPVQPSRML